MAKAYIDIFGLIGADTSGMVSQEFMLLRLIAILTNLLIIQRRELKLTERKAAT
jgi:hypothetical protein